jgi:hypothetical protein
MPHHTFFSFLILILESSPQRVTFEDEGDGESDPLNRAHAPPLVVSNGPYAPD